MESLQGEEGDEEKGDEEKGDAERKSLLDGRIWRAESFVDEETSTSGVKTTRIAVSQYTPMQGLQIVRIVLTVLMGLPFFSAVGILLYWVAIVKPLHGVLSPISVAGVMVLFLNVTPWGIITMGAQCLLSLKPDLIAAQVQVKRLRPEVERLQRDVRQELSTLSNAELKAEAMKAGTNELYWRTSSHGSAPSAHAFVQDHYVVQHYTHMYRIQYSPGFQVWRFSITTSRSCAQAAVAIRPSTDPCRRGTACLRGTACRGRRR